MQRRNSYTHSPAIIARRHLYLDARRRCERIHQCEPSGNEHL